MEIPEVTTIKTEDEARQFAIDWQNWASEQNQIGEEPTLFTSDLSDWWSFFVELGEEFNLTDEFQEEGII